MNAAAASGLQVSLVATVFNDVAGTRQFLQRMEEQTRRPDEIVITDAGSTDGTWQLLKEYEGAGTIALHALQEAKCNCARGRNLSARAAQYEIIVSTDIGCEWELDWFENLVRPFEQNSELDVAFGGWRVEWEDQKTPWAKADYVLKGGLELRPTTESHTSNRSIAYRRAFYLKLGGLPEDLTFSGDDTAMAYCIQGATDRIAAVPEPNCVWERPQSLRGLLKEVKNYNRGTGEAGLWIRDMTRTTLRLIAEAASLLLLIASALFSQLAPFRIPATVLCLLLFLWRWTSLARRRSAVRKRTGKSTSLLRMLALDYAMKVRAIPAFFQGYVNGAKRCRDCRARIRAAGIRWWN